jgi:DNA replication ATP-dependent helicase Dna2
MADEATFMRELLQGLDDSFWTATPSPDPSPIKQKKSLPPSAPCTPTKSRPSAQTAVVNRFALLFERV